VDTTVVAEASPPDAGDECRTGCDEFGGNCTSAPGEEYQATRDHLNDPDLCSGSTSDSFSASYAGHCRDGVEFLVEASNGFEARFFDSSGSFIAFITVTDDLDFGCPVPLEPAVCLA
jgi:hypothetical protein